MATLTKEQFCEILENACGKMNERFPDAELVAWKERAERTQDPVHLGKVIELEEKAKKTVAENKKRWM